MRTYFRATIYYMSNMNVMVIGLVYIHYSDFFLSNDNYNIYGSISFWRTADIYLYAYE